jgi:hypothetical protein
MDQFYTIVLSATAVLLILLLTMVGILMYTTKAVPDEPIRSKCPDYWMYDGQYCSVNGNVNVGDLTYEDSSLTGTVPKSPDNLDSKKIGYYDNNKQMYVSPDSKNWTSIYSGMSANCARGKWASDNGIVWDGYTNDVSC